MRRHSLHRNYHSDNEEIDEEDTPGDYEQAHVNSLVVIEQTRPPLGTSQSTRHPSKPQRPSPPRFRHYSDTWYSGSHPTIPYVPQEQSSPFRSDTRLPFQHDRDLFENIPRAPSHEREQSIPRIRRMRSSSLGPPIEHRAEQSPPRLRRPSPSTRVKDKSSMHPHVPSPPPFVRRQSSTRVTRSGRERERERERTRQPSVHIEQEFVSYTSDAERAPPGMKSYRKDRASTLETQFRIPGGFPSGENIRPDDSRSESSDHQQRESGKWSKKRPSHRPSLSPARTTVSTSSTPGTLGAKYYQYRPLENMQFRLVKILPARMSTIKCEIFSASLLKPPSYVAVSYAWGDTDDTRKIVLKDPETSVAVSVPVAVSLYGALEALRQKQEPVIVWIDYLCIDVKSPIF